eukprot:2530867-Pleurochrysis_carterae.AAC.1
MNFRTKNGVRSGIGGTRQKGDEDCARHAAQTPKCIRLRPSPLLSAVLILIEAEILRKRTRGHDFCPVSRSRLKVRAGHLAPPCHYQTATPCPA